MRTIAIYSYKGGVGKSLMAANLAICLSRLGRSCVLVDMDWDAPSLHNKIGVGEAVLGKGGIVEIFNQAIDSQDKLFSEAKLSDVEFRTVPEANFKRCGQELDDPRERESSPTDRPKAGKIWFFPAGNVHTTAYWNFVWSSLIRDIMTTENRYDNGEASAFDRERVTELFRDIKRSFRKLEDPEIEYLIVDCRAGASDMTTTMVNAWVDSHDLDQDDSGRMVYVSAFNEDSIGYLDLITRRVPARFRDLIVPVLSRVPRNLEFKGDRKLVSALAKISFDLKKLKAIHSDRDLEGFERLRMGMHVAPENRTMTKEYLSLFEDLIPREHWKGKKSLAEAIGFDPNELIDEKERLFSLNVKSGALINPADESRNVAFKVETFKLLLKGLENAMAQHRDLETTTARTLSETTPPTEAASLNDLLYQAGLQGGRKFGDAMAEQFVASTRMGPQEKMERWCEFDSDVGFGRFELDPESVEIRGGRLRRCDVILHQSFLTPSTDSKAGPLDHRYCELMRGYIAGVLECFLNVRSEDLRVEHRQLDALPDSDVGRAVAESCRFVVWDEQHWKKTKETEEKG